MIDAALRGLATFICGTDKVPRSRPLVMIAVAPEILPVIFSPIRKAFDDDIKSLLLALISSTRIVAVAYELNPVIVSPF